MKTKTLTQSMSWLHTWAGLVLGWILFAVFLTGTLAVFDRELNRWMQPELPAVTVTQAEAAHTAIDWLSRHHADADNWNISLPTERSPALLVSAGQTRRGEGTYLHPASGEEITPRATAGGSFFFRFHFTLQMGRMPGIWIVGLAAVAMLVLIVSGIIIHKKFFKEFFTFRPGKGQRSWLDAHNASAVLFLPFHLMITYTGLVIFYLIYMPAATDALFNGDRDAFSQALRGTTEQAGHAPAPRTGRGGHQPHSPDHTRVPLPDLEALLQQARSGLGEVGSLSISNPLRRSSRITARATLGSRLELSKGLSMVFSGHDGRVLSQPPQSRPSLLTQRVMAGLHFAQFGGYPMRWLYFICGLISSAMIATGLVLFTVKRRKRQTAEGRAGIWLYRVAEPLNMAVVAGLSLSCIALLWANRLLPAGLEARAGWEVGVFFAVWLASLLHAWGRPRLRGWFEQLSATALLCLALPLLSLSAPAASSPFWFDLSLLGLGLLLARMAYAVKRRIPSPAAAQPTGARV